MLDSGLCSMSDVFCEDDVQNPNIGDGYAGNDGDEQEDGIDNGGGADHHQDHDHDNEGWRRVQDRNRFPRNFAPGHHQLLATIAIIAQTLTVMIIIVQHFHTNHDHDHHKSVVAVAVARLLRKR